VTALRRLRLVARRDDGAQAVEFALISLPLLGLIYGLIAFGFTFNQQITATQLAREGARTAAICAGDATQTQATCEAKGVARMTADMPNWTGAVPAVNASGCYATPQTSAVATLNVPPALFIPFLTNIHGKASTPCGG
jgi:Flp pilus assembly protein TadG